MGRGKGSAEITKLEKYQYVSLFSFKESFGFWFKDFYIVFLLPSPAPDQNGMWMFGVRAQVTLWLWNEEGSDQHLWVPVSIPVLHLNPLHSAWSCWSFMDAMLSTSELKLMV